jgi:hypothetical protein
VKQNPKDVHLLTISRTCSYAALQRKRRLSGGIKGPALFLDTRVDTLWPQEYLNDNQGDAKMLPYRVPAWQVQGPEFNHHSTKGKVTLLVWKHRKRPRDKQCQYLQMSILAKANLANILTLTHRKWFQKLDLLELRIQLWGLKSLDCSSPLSSNRKLT